MSNKIFKCPMCSKEFKDKSSLYFHVEKEHNDIIPSDMSIPQFLFNLRNKKSYGTCVQCKVNKTEWNEQAERYDRFCSTPCKNKYVDEAKRRMIAKYGKEHLLNNPEHQQKMLNNRSISGEYKFQSDNTVLKFNSSYEYDFLKYCDVELGLFGAEIVKCPYFFEYEYNNKKHIYIPDYFLPNYNLIVELKDGGDNPNNHPKIQSVDKIKEVEKDKTMKSQNKYHYIKITDKKYNMFIYVLNLIRDTNYEDPDFSKMYNTFKII